MRWESSGVMEARRRGFFLFSNLKVISEN